MPNIVDLSRQLKHQIDNWAQDKSRAKPELASDFVKFEQVTCIGIIR